MAEDMQGLLVQLDQGLRKIVTEWKEGQQAVFELLSAILQEIELLARIRILSPELKKAIAIKAFERYVLSWWLKIPILKQVVMFAIQKKFLDGFIDWLVGLNHAQGVGAFVKKGV